MGDNEIIEIQEPELNELLYEYEDPNQQPGKIAGLNKGTPVKIFSNTLNPGTIESAIKYYSNQLQTVILDKLD